MEFPLSIQRQDAFPLDKSSVFYSLEEAEEYASTSPLSYPTQVIGVIDESADSAKLYRINVDGTLAEIGSSKENKLEWGSIG